MFDTKILPKIIILLTMFFGTGFIGNIGIPGLVIILLIILVLFGPKTSDFWTPKSNSGS